MLVLSRKIQESVVVGGGGSFLVIPVSMSMVVVTRKKIRSRKAISAIDPAFISLTGLAIMITFYLNKPVIPEYMIETTANPPIT